MTVWIYVNTSRQVDDADHIKVFANQDAAETWFGIVRPGRRCFRIRSSGMKEAAN
jgi:hypothetical protein